MERFLFIVMMVLFCLTVIVGCRSKKLIKEEYQKTTTQTTEIVIE